MGNESQNNTGSDKSPGTCKERDGEICPTDTGQHQNKRATEDHTTWNIAYPKKGTIHQIEFYLILTLGPRNGPGYYVVLWREVKGNNNNHNNNNNNNNNNNKKIIIIY